MINNILYFVLFCSFSFSQYWEPFHYQESIKYDNIIIDFESTDREAQLNVLEPYTRSILTHEVVGYLPYWEYDSYPDLDYDLLTQLNFFSAELDPYGNIINDHNWNELYLVEYAHARNVKVKLCATLFGQNELTILLSDSLHRQNAINNLLELVTVSYTHLRAHET